MKTTLSFIILFVAISLMAEWSIVSTYQIPEGAAGLAYNGQYLYCGIYGANGDQVYRIDPTDGSYQLLFSGPQGDAFGMTYDGTYLWITDHPGSSSTPALAMQLDMTGNILDQFDLPDHYMSGIAYDNGDFWVATYYDPDGHIYKLDDQGNILQSFPAPDNQPWDLCLENGYLWMADYWGDTLYKIDPSDGTLLESYPSESNDPAGIVYDGQYLWYCDNGSGGYDYLYKIDLGGAGTPQIHIGISEYDFGEVILGTSDQFDLLISNNGNALLEIQNLTFTDPAFSCSATLPVEIDPESNTSLSISFSPVAVGEYNGNLIIGCNDPVTPQVTIELTGYGIAPDPDIEVSPLSLNYSNIRLHAFTGRYIQISNQGAGELLIDDYLFSHEYFGFDTSTDALFPLTLATQDIIDLRIWFNPQATGNFEAALYLYSNDPDENPVEIVLQGSAIDQDYPIASLLWEYQIDTSWDNSPKAMAAASDINGDQKNDLIICSEDNFIRCFNGNASVTADILWEFAVPSGNVYSQKGLDIGPDINGDSYLDIVVGTTGGDRSIRVISGYTGEQLWMYDTHNYGSGGWVYQVCWQYDFNTDGVPDVLAGAGDDASDTGPKRIFCLNGVNGAMLWNYPVGGPVFSVMGIPDVTGDGIPDVAAGASNNWETIGLVIGINGSNGSYLWQYETTGSSVWGLAAIDDITGDAIDDVLAGDFSGNFYGIDGAGGNVQWSGTIGNYVLITRMEILGDVTGDGHPDVLVENSGNYAVVIDAYNGSLAWTQYIGDNSLSVSRIADISGDGINDVLIGSLNSNAYFLDGVTGTVVASSYLGTAVDAITAIPDITGDSSWEMVAGGRNGLVYCLAGGLNAVTAQDNLLDLSELVSLQGNFPNPFNPETCISFILKAPGRISLKIYNSRGQQVINLLDEHLGAGEYSIYWDGRDALRKTVSSGIYLYQVKMGEATHTSKMMLIK